MTATAEQPESKIGEDRRYWTHKVKPFPEPVAQFRMAQLIDFDDRLYETARVVYRFLVGWYHHEHGDALMSQRHVAKVMKQRAPEGAVVPSRNAVQRAIIALMDTGWVVRTAKGRGRKKTASRYVPVVNVLELAEQGKFPELAHVNGPDEGDCVVAHANGPVLSEPAHANGPDCAELAHATGPKTLLPDPRTLDSGTGNVSIDVSATALAPGLAAAPGGDGFEMVWRAYGKLGNKAAARDVFATIIEPDVDHIAGRAASWAASAKPGRPRMPLEKWLAAERYDEADRSVVRERKSKPTPANDNAPADIDDGEWDVGPFSPFGTFRGTIVEADYQTNGTAGSTLIVGIDMSGRGGVDITHTAKLKQARGQRFHNELSALSGCDDWGEAEDFIGTKVNFTISDRGKISYHRRAA